MSSPKIIDRSNFNMKTILLAEDSEDDVFIMRRTFQKAGIPNPLQFVPDGEQAISYLEGRVPYSDRGRHPLPVMALLDLNMPKKSGLDVLAWIRAHPQFRRLPVYILTASSRRADIASAFELGANAYIVKPGELEVLTELVKAWHDFVQFQAFTELA